MLIETEVELQRSPAVASDCDPASRPAVVAAARRSSQGCSTSGGLSGFVDGGTREPETPAGDQQAKNEQEGWYQQGQLDGGSSTLVRVRSCGAT